jgi:hypothetical protein
MRLAKSRRATLRIDGDAIEIAFEVDVLDLLALPQARSAGPMSNSPRRRWRSSPSSASLLQGADGVA